nr:MAG TPA: hypothetical protein [Caudoviricetes sp.]
MVCLNKEMHNPQYDDYGESNRRLLHGRTSKL